MAIEYRNLVELVQDTPDTSSYVGQPGRQKFLAAPVVNGVEIEGLANGPRGHMRSRIGSGKPIYIFEGRKEKSWLSPEEVERYDPFRLFVGLVHPEWISEWNSDLGAVQITEEQKKMLLQERSE